MTKWLFRAVITVIILPLLFLAGKELFFKKSANLSYTFFYHKKPRSGVLSYLNTKADSIRSDRNGIVGFENVGKGRQICSFQFKNKTYSDTINVFGEGTTYEFIKLDSVLNEISIDSSKKVGYSNINSPHIPLKKIAMTPVRSALNQHKIVIDTSTVEELMIGDVVSYSEPGKKNPFLQRVGQHENMTSVTHSNSIDKPLLSYYYVSTVDKKSGVRFETDCDNCNFEVNIKSINYKVSLNSASEVEEPVVKYIHVIPSMFNLTVINNKGDQYMFLQKFRILNDQCLCIKITNR